MTTSSEDVLLLVNHVRHKKSDGTLYVMGERLAWIMNGKDTFSVSHKYADIKIQKISPDGKSKVQLQVVLHDGGASTFHFTNPVGIEAQIQDRDSVKETLQQLLPRFKRKINKELEEKNKMLVEDPELFQLYRDLVTSQVITPEEFWETHAPQKQKGLPQACQDVGVSGAFLAGIKPQSDGCNGLKYNLTADIIESIFKTYPAVKKKHLEYVPDKLSESEFWTRFFQSHYFHRDRLNSGLKDVFSECMKNDEQDIQNEITQIVSDPLIDMTSFTDSTLDEGYGEGNAVQHTNAVNQNMIRRFNHHSMMVLKACEKQSPSTSSSQISTSLPEQKITKDKNESFNKGPNVLNGMTVHKHLAETETEDISSKRAKVQSKVLYEDLENKQNKHAPALNLSRADRYFHGPTPVSNVDYVTNEELLQTIHVLHQEVEHWKPNLPMVLPSNLAITGLGELSPGGALMKRAGIENLQQSVPVHLQQELKHLYLALCELLRHFWSCFPVTNDQLEEKLIRMRGNLERFQYAKLMPFQDSLLRDHYSTNLTSHLNDMIETAINKFNTWQMRRISKK